MDSSLSRWDIFYSEVRNCFRPILDLPRYRISRVRSKWLFSFEDTTTCRPKGVVLIVCGFGSKIYQDAAYRLSLQALQSGFFEKIVTVTKLDQLAGLSKTRIDQYEKFAEDFPRGYGLWAWKPLVLASVMKTLPEGAAVFYMDSGCEISLFGLQRYLSYLEEIYSKGSLFFSIPYREFEWTAASVLKKFNRNVKDDTNQIQATWFALKNTQVWRDFITEWADNCQMNDFILLKPFLSKSDNLMLAHREDQSILSCMLKQSGAGNIHDWEDYFHPDFYYENSWVLMMPFHTLRTTGKKSKINRLVSLSSPTACLKNMKSHGGSSLFISIKMSITTIFDISKRIALILRMVFRVLLSKIKVKTYRS